MNKSSLGAFGIPEYMPPDGGGTFIVNLPAPTSERTTMNERNPGAFGIPESMPPDGGETFIVIKKSSGISSKALINKHNFFINLSCG